MRKLANLVPDRYYNVRLKGGHSSAGRASASQAEGRGFESRCPLHFFILFWYLETMRGTSTNFGPDSERTVRYAFKKHKFTNIVKIDTIFGRY